MIREKIANMATLIYVGESLVYRTVGMMDKLLDEIDKASPDASKQMRKAIEEYAVECSIIKVWGSEMIDYVVDETMQIYAGYGFVEEYPAERAYRDARINRIFEGTNEINRLIITGFLLKRAMSGQLPLMPAIKKLMDEVLSGPSMGEEIEGATGRRAQASGERQEVGPVCCGCRHAEIHGGDSGSAGSHGRDRRYDHRDLRDGIGCAARAEDRRAKGEAAAALPIAMTRVYMTQAFEKVEAAAKKVIADVADGDMLRTQLAIVRRLAKHDPFNTIALRQQIALKTIEAGKYSLA